jgi:hypothetical protein
MAALVPTRKAMKADGKMKHTVLLSGSDKWLAPLFYSERSTGFSKTSVILSGQFAGNKETSMIWRPQLENVSTYPSCDVFQPAASRHFRMSDEKRH